MKFDLFFDFYEKQYIKVPIIFIYKFAQQKSNEKKVKLRGTRFSNQNKDIKNQSSGIKSMKIAKKKEKQYYADNVINVIINIKQRSKNNDIFGASTECKLYPIKTYRIISGLYFINLIMSNNKGQVKREYLGYLGGVINESPKNEIEFIISIIITQGALIVRKNLFIETISRINGVQRVNLILQYYLMLLKQYGISYDDLNQTENSQLIFILNIFYLQYVSYVIQLSDYYLI
eukprot:EST41388.1 Hypothetical protein SS50377_19104 [Spironucleus salmonicida]